MQSLLLLIFLNIHNELFRVESEVKAGENGCMVEESHVKLLLMTVKIWKHP